MDRASVIELINAVLVTSAGSTPLHELNRSYKNITGDSIKYRELGYESLEDFIQSVPTFTCIRRAGEIFVSPAPDEKTAHITKLIKGQKNQKSKRPRNPNKYDGDGSFRNFAYRQKYPKPKDPPQSAIGYHSSHANWRQNANIESRENWESTNSRIEPQNSRQPNSRIESPGSWRSNVKIQSQQSWDSDTRSESQGRRQSNARTESKGSWGSSAKSEPQESFGSNTLIEFKGNRQSYARIESQENRQSNTNVENRPKKLINTEQFKKRVADWYTTSTRSRSSSSSISNNVIEDEFGISVTLKDHNRQVLLSERFQRMTCRNNKAISLLADDEDDADDVFNTDYVNGYNESDSGKITNKDCTPQAMFARGKELSKSGVFKDIPKQQPVATLPRYNMVQSPPMPVANYSSGLNVILPSAPPIPYFRGSDISYSTLPNINVKIENRMEDGRNNKTNEPFVNDASLMNTSVTQEMPVVKEWHCQKLLEFTRQHGLPNPFYHTTKQSAKRNRDPFFACSIEIEGSSFSSLPSDAKTEMEAREIAAGKAYNCLYEEMNMKLKKKLIAKQSQADEMLTRIAEMVKKHTSGLFSKKIEDDYILFFNEALPDNWLELVKKSPKMTVDETLGGVVVLAASDDSFNGSIIETIESMPPLVLPVEDEWDVYSTCSTSVTSIWFRIIGREYSEEYFQLSTNINEYYSKAGLRQLTIGDIKKDCFYIACIKDDYFRVQFLDFTHDAKCRCFLIDHGDVETFNGLLPLDKQFSLLPAQAVRCSLTGLEEYNHLITDEMLEELIGHSYVASVNNRENGRPQLTLFDTRNDHEDVNVNEQLKNKLLSLTSSTELSSNKVTLTSFLTPEEVYIQPITKQLTYLKTLITKAGSTIDSNRSMYQLKSEFNIIKKKKYLVNYVSDGTWHRGIVENVTSKNTIAVLYVDYGNLGICSLNDLVSLDGFPDELETIPNQAIKVRLHNISMLEVDEQAMLKVREIIMEDEPLVMREKEKTDSFRVVELFKETPSGTLLSINEFILKCSAAEKGIVSNDSTECLLDLDISEFCKPLPEKPLTINTQIAVYVTLCASPSNFYFQYCCLREKLNELNQSMTDYYESPDNRGVPVPEDGHLQPENVFACKLRNSWHRVSICKLLQKSDVSVNLVDYGSVEVTTKDNLRYLHPDFASLESVSKNAELIGIVPNDGDWSINAIVMFQKIAQDKAFIAFILNTSDEKIGVRLFDTGDNGETDISASLVKAGYAVDLVN